MTRVATDSKPNLEDSIFQGHQSIDAFSKISTSRENVNASLSIDQVKKSQHALRALNEIVKMNYRETNLNKL